MTHLRPALALTSRLPLRSALPLRPSPLPLIHPVSSRFSSHSPLASTSPSTRKKVTLPHLLSLHRRSEPITVLTAHDFPSAHVASTSGIEIILVGDSLAMVALGLSDTVALTLDEMIMHCKSVARGAGASFTIADLPMGTYEVSPSQALESAIRVVKEGGMMGVKLEGGVEMAPTIKRITDAGIAVMGHVGLTPQRQNSLGGFRVQGKTVAGAMRLLDDALAVQEAGAFAMVLEAVPAEVAEMVTKRLRIPTIGIGAGSGCSGQVLVQVDMGGNFPPGRFLPKFVKKYGDVWGEMSRACEEYIREVKSRTYPAPEHTYPVKEDELRAIEKAMEEKTQK
ncbi:3-methyl-2-oxobutanoate hydroxymethyltransferase [Sphaceloma murrayae]|uniref:3-methyl-2-oxobutanoate hydroxymethyltransferase n=1 Tax=Sphaceloma murrayae TaxID=2082308 RepID=A0A2K1QIM8_9PEZI|nr:3-methyl-2-oxobutanoate hydroxymethyltransferase [Sphaceloma murrayae]